MESVNELKYHHNKPSEEFRKVLEWVKPNSKVLEFGCHTGVLSSSLKKQGCNVTGVEINSKALDHAKPYLNQSLCLDINSETAWTKYLNQKVDVITWIHVLEHLIDPEANLKRSVELLNPNGVIIIALPNISNARERFDFLFGKFEYSETGVMDNTHIKFYNYKTAIELIEKSGLEIVNYYSAWQTNPSRQFLRHLPVLHHITKFMKENTPPRFPKYSKNMTDVTMLFKCVRKK